MTSKRGGLDDVPMENGSNSESGSEKESTQNGRQFRRNFKFNEEKSTSGGNSQDDVQMQTSRHSDKDIRKQIFTLLQKILKSQDRVLESQRRGIKEGSQKKFEENIIDQLRQISSGINLKTQMIRDNIVPIQTEDTEVRL